MACSFTLVLPSGPCKGPSDNRHPCEMIDGDKAADKHRQLKVRWTHLTYSSSYLGG